MNIIINFTKMHNLILLTDRKGIPNLLCENVSRITLLPQSVLPSVGDAVEEYERNQGVLTYESCFGEDILQGRPDLQQKRQRVFSSQNPPYSTIFTNIISSDGQMLANAIDSFHKITIRLSGLA